jgi:DNA modification methylase
MNKIEFGDCREIMRSWAQAGVTVQTCVTSPPYYGLRDYGHQDQIGREETPDEYINNMVEVFRCVRDILADDGTLWINIGDSYNGSGGQGTKPNIMSKESASARGGKPIRVDGIKPKDMVGIPWMLAFALRADGWYLRQDIIWNKPSHMPESVTDRCTKSHEYIFLLAKSQKYFFDHESIKEPLSDPTRTNFASGARTNGINHDRGDNDLASRSRDVVYTSKNKRSVWTVSPRPYAGAHFAVYPEELIVPCVLAGSRKGDTVLDPFMGSGTTAAVALKNGRQYLGCELNPEYKTLQDERLAAATVIHEKNVIFDQLFQFD